MRANHYLWGDMGKLQEHDSMTCRACGNEERASEGYPCADCGTFLCVMCDMRGVTRCRECQAKHGPGTQTVPTNQPAARRPG